MSDQSPTRPVFALVDCNNFFVSCVRVFRPDLDNKPVVALSSNDGCVVARSNEAKALGIPMGAPAFRWRQFFKKHGVVQVSGNFELYGDMSRRITSILTTVTPLIEVYSVDESFLDLSQLNITNYTAWGREVRQRILKWTGIPISIGIGPTKTLAKLAASRSKKELGLGGVLDLATAHTHIKEDQLAKTPIEDVWGVGWRLAPKLRAESIATALDLAKMRPQLAQQLMGVHGRQMISELNGTCCLPLEHHGKPCQSIASTRTFGEDTNQLHVLESAIATFVARAAYKLRASQQLARHGSIFIATNRHKPGFVQLSDQLQFLMPSSDTGALTSQLTACLANLFRPHYYYHRAGIALYNFIPQDALQIDILGRIDPAIHTRSMQRMDAVDNLNQRFGKNTIYYASKDLAASWQPKHEIGVPRFTTHWDELPKINGSLSR